MECGYVEATNSPGKLRFANQRAPAWKKVRGEQLQRSRAGGQRSFVFGLRAKRPRNLEGKKGEFFHHPRKILGHSLLRSRRVLLATEAASREVQYKKVDEGREGQRHYVLPVSELSACREFSVHNICVFLQTRFCKDPVVQSFLPGKLLRIVDCVGLGKAARPNAGVPTFLCASLSLEGLLRPPGLGQDLRVSISNVFPGIVDAAGPGPSSENHGHNESKNKVF